MPQHSKISKPFCLAADVELSADKVLNSDNLASVTNLAPGSVVLVVLAAGKGTRFGQSPKCIQNVNGKPLARHSIDSFHIGGVSSVICLVGYRYQEVAAALGEDNVYILTGDPTGGTALAAYETFSVPGLLEKDPLLVITMGDRIVPPSIFSQLLEAHCEDGEAALTFLTARYEPPTNRGKGRVLRDESGRVLRIIEERDIDLEPDETTRQALHNLTEGNCPLYAIRASTLYRHLRDVSNQNAQGQYYITDIIETIRAEGGTIRTITTTPAAAEYELLCADVTRPEDLARLEAIFEKKRELLRTEQSEALQVRQAARILTQGRPPGQIDSIVRQLEELAHASKCGEMNFDPEEPVGIGVSGGRLRLAFMHPDMMRFYGPAWQMPIGAGHEEGSEQIIMLAQTARDREIHLHLMNPHYREKLQSLPADNSVMYPHAELNGWHQYEEFGTRMSENLLLSLGYFSYEELSRRRENGQPLPPPALWISNNMRRPFPLICNAIASLRTVTEGSLGAKIQRCLGRDDFQGLWLASTGDVPPGGFASSSAVTVATKNALNALYGFDLSPDLMVHLACQAEYGTGVRAGSLDQATEQKGVAGQGTLISSNPEENYRTIGIFPVPTDRICILYPYTVDRDREAWQWSWGIYTEAQHPQGPLTTSEMRKLTGKAAEIAALLVRLPLRTTFFEQIEKDLLEDGELSEQSRASIAATLLQLPLLATQQQLQNLIEPNREWYIEQLVATEGLTPSAARDKAGEMIASLFAGWRDPQLRRQSTQGEVVEETGVPLRAIVAYLFGEVAKNFYLIHNPQQWIEYVAHSQRGDRCVNIDPQQLPNMAEMEGEMEWEVGSEGPQRLNLWLDRCGAHPFDYNDGLDDATLSRPNPPEFRQLAGSNFFRGLALIDLAEAMLWRAFGRDAIAVRVNAAGQGDFFQVHVDRQKANPERVKQFIRTAFYRRFGIKPEPEFVEPHPGGHAVGVRLNRFALLSELIELLQSRKEKAEYSAT